MDLELTTSFRFVGKDSMRREKDLTRLAYGGGNY